MRLNLLDGVYRYCCDENLPDRNFSGRQIGAFNHDRIDGNFGIASTVLGFEFIPRSNSDGLVPETGLSK